MSAVRARELSVIAAFSDSGWRMGLCARKKAPIASSSDATTDTLTLADARRGSSNRLRIVRPNDARSSAFQRSRMSVCKRLRPGMTATSSTTRGGLQRLADQLEIVRLEPARRAAVEVIGNRNAIGDGQLLVVEGRELGAHLLAAPGQHRRSPSSTRSAWRARVSLDLTVPTGNPSEKAISSYFNPSISRSTSAVRCSNGRL